MRWSEPAIWRERSIGATIDPAALTLSGLEQLHSITAPPAMYHLTGTTFDSASPGEATFSMPVTPWLRTPQGAVPGGILAIPGDGALGCAIHTRLPAGVVYTTAELSMTYLRPATVGTAVHAHGRALHVGRSLALSDCSITDEHGVLLAHATSRCMVFGTGRGGPARSGTATPPPLAPATEQELSGIDPFMRDAVGTVLDQAVWDTTSGLDVLRAQIAGSLPAPPMHHLLGITPVAATEGGAECAMPLTQWLNTPWGWPQGGFIAVLADTALAMSVQTTVPAGTAFAPVDIKVNYLRPVVGDGSVLHARATVVHRGRSLVVATAEIIDDSGRVAALATGSAHILPGRRAALAELAG